MLYKKRWNKNNITLIYIMAFNALGDVESGVLMVCDDSEDQKNTKWSRNIYEIA